MPLNVDVVSDVVCPWCFIGKRRLEKALRSLARPGDVRVRWRPFELNPGLPKEGVERKPFHEAKFGGKINLEAAYARVTAIGAEEGIAFAQDRIQRQPNTLDAHRLLGWAFAQGKQDALAESLFLAFFCEGLDVGDFRVLADRAALSGLDAAQALSFLKSGEGTVETREEETLFRQGGIRSVPTFLFNNRIALTGAETPDVILAALEEILTPAP